MQENCDYAVSEKKYARKDKAKWLAWISEWEAGKESRAVFCKRLGLNINTFTYIRAKLKKPNQPLASKFVPVTIKKETGEKVLIVSKANLILENRIGLKLTIPCSLEKEQFKQLLEIAGW